MEPILNTSTRSSCALDYDFKSGILFWWVPISSSSWYENTLLVSANCFILLIWKYSSGWSLLYENTLLVGLNFFKSIFLKWKLAVKIISILQVWCNGGEDLLSIPCWRAEVCSCQHLPTSTMTIHHPSWSWSCIMMTPQSSALSVLRSVVVEEGVVTADGLAVDWVCNHCCLIHQN